MIRLFEEFQHFGLCIFRLKCEKNAAHNKQKYIMYIETKKDSIVELRIGIIKKE